jgi:hypothetical protein
VQQAQNQRRPAGRARPAAGASKRFSTAPQERRTSGDQPTKQDQRLGQASASLQRLKSAKPAETSRRSKTSGWGKQAFLYSASRARNKRRPRSKTSGWGKQALLYSASRAQIQQEQAKNQRFRVTSALRGEPVTSEDTRGASARRRSQTLGVRTVERRSAKEFEDGRVRQVGLTRKLPSPALKEAERSGSYNPSALNTLTRGTVRHGTRGLGGGWAAVAEATSKNGALFINRGNVPFIFFFYRKKL